MNTLESEPALTQPRPSVAQFKSNSNSGAIVLASSYTALGLVRGLGHHSIPVWVLGKNDSLAGASRYARRTLPLEGDDEEQQIDCLLNLTKRHALQGWTLFPDSDKSAALLARHYQSLSEHYRLTVPPWDVLRWAFDKRSTYALAAESGIDYPLTLYPTSRADVETFAGKFPVVLKPANHQGHDRFSLISGAWRADNLPELLALYDQAGASADPSVVMIQEMIPGGGEAQFGFAALCQDARVIACAHVNRQRLIPIDFGSCVYAITTHKPEIELAARRWLERANYSGLVYMEFKFDARDGRYKLLDVNARAWITLPLCPRAGVDFAYLMWQQAQGEPVAPMRAREGVRWVRTWYDLMSALQAMRRGTLSFGEYLRSLKGAEHEMYACDDLMPAVVELPLLLRLAWQRLGERSR